MFLSKTCRAWDMDQAWPLPASRRRFVPPAIWRVSCLIRRMRRRTFRRLRASSNGKRVSRPILQRCFWCCCFMGIAAEFNHHGNRRMTARQRGRSSLAIPQWMAPIRAPMPLDTRQCARCACWSRSRSDGKSECVKRLEQQQNRAGCATPYDRNMV
jgi:hypothetical protein